MAILITMNELNEFLTPFFLKVRCFTKSSPVISVLRHILVFVQISVFFLDFHKATDLYTVNSAEDSLKYAQELFSLSPWVFGTKSYLFDSLLYFIFLGFIFGFLIYRAYSAKHNKEIPSRVLARCRLVLGFAIPILKYPLCVRFCYLAFLANESATVYGSVSLAFCVLNVLIFFFLTFVQSIYLENRDITVSNVFEELSGESYFIYSIFTFFIMVFTNFYSSFTSTLHHVILLILHLIFIIAIIKMRAATVFSQSRAVIFLDTAPYVLSIFLVEFECFASKLWYYKLVFYLAICVVYMILLNAYIDRAKVKSIRMFELMLPDSNNQDDSAMQTVPSNVDSVIRYYCFNVNDPSKLHAFIEAQRGNLKPSHIIEIVRFLVIYPEKRKRAIEIIKELEVKSIYDKFKVSLFEKQFQYYFSRSYFLESFPALETLFKVHAYKFWEEEANGNSCKALLEVFNAYYYFREYSYLLQQMVRNSPNNVEILKRYSDFLDYWIFDPDSADIARSRLKLLLGKADVVDPLFYSMAGNIPAILKFAKEKTINSNSSIHSLTNTLSAISDHEEPTTKGKQRVQMTSFKMNMIFYFLLILILFIPLAFIFCLTLYIVVQYQRTVNAGSTIVENVETLSRILIVSSSSFIELSYMEYSNITIPTDISDKETCMQLYTNLTNGLISFYESLPQVQELIKLVVHVNYNDFYLHPGDYQDICTFLYDLNDRFVDLSSYNADNLISNLTSIKESIVNYNKASKLSKVCGWCELVIVCALVLCVAVFTYAMSKKFKNAINGNRKILEFNTSKRRLSLLLFNKYIDAYYETQDQPASESDLIEYAEVNSKTRNQSPVFLADDLYSESMKKIRDQQQAQAQHLQQELETSISQTKTPQNAPEQLSMEEVDSLIEGSSSKGFLGIYFNAFSIWIVVIVVLLCMCLSPVLFDSRSSENEDVITLTEDIGHAFSVIDVFLTAFQTNESVTENITKYINTMDSLTSDVKTSFTKEQCFQLNSVLCTSVRKIFLEIANKSCIQNELLINRYLPIVTAFFHELTNNILYDAVRDMTGTTQSNAIVFLVLSFVICVTIFPIKLLHVRTFFTSINSIMSYPQEFDKVEDNNENKLPDSVVVVSSVNTNNEIYSITSNSVSLLGRNPIDFVCMHFDSLFKPVASTEDLLEYLMPDHRTKKIFRASYDKSGVVSKSILFEEKKSPEKDHEGFIGKLSQAMPAAIARIVTDTPDNLIFENSVVIIVRFDSSKDQKTIDRFFTHTNMVGQDYSDVKLIFAECNVMVYVVEENSSILVPVLFARDTVTALKKKMRGDSPLESITIRNVGRLSLHLDVSIEPYLSVENHVIIGSISEAEKQDRFTVSVDTGIIDKLYNKILANRPEKPALQMTFDQYEEYYNSL